jgi:hypothetical protein
VSSGQAHPGPPHRRAHRTSDILEALLAQICKLDRDFAENLIARRRRNADTTRFGDALKTGCDIDAIAKNVMGFDDYVADINAYAKGETLVFSVANREVMDAFLELRCSPNRLDRAPKFCQEAIARVLDDAAAVNRDRRLYSVRQKLSQTGVRRLFVIVHQTRVARDIGGQYRRQPAFNPTWLLLHHGTQIPSRASIVRQISLARQRALDFAWPDRLKHLEPLELRVPEIEWLVVDGLCRMLACQFGARQANGERA